MPDYLKQIDDVDPVTFRAQWWADALAGRLKPRINNCPHPKSSLEEYVDEAPGREDRPVNLYRCSLCNLPLALADPFGRFAADR